MKHTKRILSVLICLAMVLSLLSVVSFAADPSKLYLKPNSNWTQANARFAAYFFGNGDQWVSCTPVAGASGIYEVEVPAGFTSVIFCRMNPSTTDNNWDNKWNQTGDLTIPTDGKNCFTVQSGAWNGATTTWGSYTPPTCDHPSHGQDGKCTACGDVVPHSFKDGVCTVCAAADPDYTDITVYCINSANWSEVAAYAWTEGGAGLSWPGELMTKTGKTYKGYDVYEVTFHYAYEKVIFNNNNGSQTADLALMAGQYYDVESKTWYPSLDCEHKSHNVEGICDDCGNVVGHDFADGTCGICGAADPDYVSITVYCINSSNWAEVTAYAWTDGGVGMSWPGEPMTKTENTVNGFDVYEITLHTAYENIIFNNNNNGYQTGDQILMAGQYFDVKDAIWYASLEDVPEVEDPGVTEPVAPSYYVAGDMNGWNSCDAAYIMNAEADGIYTLTFAVTAGDYGLKVTNGTWDNSWGKDGGNYTFKAYTDGEVTVTFNTADFSVNVTGECLTNPTPACEHTSHDADGICADCGETVGHSFVDGVCSCGKTEEVVVPSVNYIVAGSPDLCGAGSTDYGWDPSDLSNLMTDNGDGTFSKVYSNVLPGDGYELKIVEEIDGTYNWIGVDGGADNMVFNVTDTCDVTVTFNPETKEITVTGEYVKLPGSELKVEYITVTGNGDGTWLNGANWDPADLSNQMDIIYQDYYVITYDNVECFDNYQVKFTADGSWAHNWGGVYMGSGIETDAVYNGDNITITVPYELAEVTIFLDLMNYDHSTKTGAKFTVYVTEIDPVCEHTSHDQDGNCADCGVYVGHNFVNGACDCGKVIGYITVYFRNNWYWSNVSAYYWGSELWADPNWPGVGMDVYGNNGVHDIYCTRIPADIDGLIFTGTKDDGSGATDQTPNITDFSDGICYYMEWADGNLALTQTLEEAMACPHNVIHVDAVPATCYANGNIEYWYCDICGQAWLDADCILNTNLKAVVLPMGHGEITHVEAVAATCYEDGNIEYWYCADCGQAWLDEACTLNTNLKAVVLPMGHGEITHVEASAATCFENGNIEYWYCADCGQAWLDEDCTLNTNLMSVVSPISHNVLHVEAAAATCFENGNIEYWYCADCGQAWLDELCHMNTNLKSVILPMGHGEITHVEAIAANCYLDGNIEYWFCEACGQAWLDADCIRNTNLMSVILPSQGHSFADGICGICGEADPDYVPPVEKPIKVENLTMVSNTRTSITVSWDAFDGAENYWLFLDGAAYNCTAGTTMTITGRQVATAYEIYVLAVMDDGSMLKAADADVLTAETKDYELSGYAYSEGRDIHVEWEADGCNRAWMLYGTNADDLIVYDESNDGTFTKANLKAGTTYYVQIAYLIDNKVIYGEIMAVYVFSNTEFIPL